MGNEHLLCSFAFITWRPPAGQAAGDAAADAGLTFFSSRALSRSSALAMQRFSFMSAAAGQVVSVRITTATACGEPTYLSFGGRHRTKRGSTALPWVGRVPPSVAPRDQSTGVPCIETTVDMPVESHLSSRDRQLISERGVARQH